MAKKSETGPEIGDNPCPHEGTGFANTCEDCLDQRLGEAHISGRSSGAEDQKKFILKLIQELAGKKFVEHKESEAQLLRNLADDINKLPAL